jgi:hypothetical protein
MVRDVRQYLLEHGWSPYGRPAPDGSEWWVADTPQAESFPGGALALAAQVQLELDRINCELRFSERVRAKLVELGWESTTYGFLVDRVGDGRSHPLAVALDVQLRREEWHARRTGAELLTPPPMAAPPPLEH